uniref:exodeoxyribonuclease III n=1 Tax=Molossus molossus TaxID=27622 RepID=A0A7J8I1F5_MOLMO|nr:hypothetical protein HJG59_010841 [Molossus molossus]
MEKIFQANGKEKKAGVAILISDKIDFRMKAIIRDKEGHYIILKGSIQQEDITLINIYAPNIGAPKYIKNVLEDFKGEINSNTIIAGDFNTPLTSLDRSSRQKISKETETLNEALDQMDLIDIYRELQPKTTEFTFFSSAHGTFSKIDHMLGHKLSLYKFKKIEIISSIFSDHNGMKLEINCKKNIQRHLNTWKLNSMLLNTEWVTEEIKEEIKTSWKPMKIRHNNTKSMGCSESISEIEVHSTTGLPQETRNISNRLSNVTT